MKKIPIFILILFVFSIFASCKEEERSFDLESYKYEIIKKLDNDYEMYTSFILDTNRYFSFYSKYKNLISNATLKTDVDKAYYKYVYELQYNYPFQNNQKIARILENDFQKIYNEKIVLDDDTNKILKMGTDYAFVLTTNKDFVETTKLAIKIKNNESLNYYFNYHSSFEIYLWYRSDFYNIFNDSETINRLYYSDDIYYDEISQIVKLMNKHESIAKNIRQNYSNFVYDLYLGTISNDFNRCHYAVFLKYHDNKINSKTILDLQYNSEYDFTIYLYLDSVLYNLEEMDETFTSINSKIHNVYNIKK